MKNLLINLMMGSLISVSAFAAPKQKAAPVKAAPMKAAPAAAPAPAAAMAAPAMSRPMNREYGMAGCGLGAIVMGKKGGQVFAATTNGTFYSQMFGITSGTSGCKDSPADEVAQRMDRFISANKVAVVRDMSRGEGETLASLSEMMGCSGQTAEIGTEMQRNLPQILKDSEGYSNMMTDNIITIVRSNEALSSSCKI